VTEKWFDILDHTYIRSTSQQGGAPMNFFMIFSTKSLKSLLYKMI